MSVADSENRSGKQVLVGWKPCVCGTLTRDERSLCSDRQALHRKQDLNAMSRGGDGAMDCGIDESNKQVSKTGDRQ